VKKIILLPIITLSFASVSMGRECGDDARAALQNTYPGFAFESVNPTPIAGVCAVESEKNTIYFAPATGHLIFGEIWSKDGKNITAARQEKIIAKALDSLPLSKAVKIGHGPNTIIEITDPDCPFCRRGAAFFAGRTDVTRYIFFLPLDGLHPAAAEKAEYILAAPDRTKAYEQVMAGAYDQSPLPAFTTKGLLGEHRNIAATLQVTSTPRYWINDQAVSGFNSDQINKILQNNAGSGVSGANQ
jgi:thiol:disulfide interchange protein DsbC